MTKLRTAQIYTRNRARTHTRVRRLMPIFGGLMGVLLVSTPAHADENSADWMRWATQTCVAQAPENRVISSLNLSPVQLQFNCRCVARDMMDVLSFREREELLVQMRQRKNMQRVVEKLFDRREVKESVLACQAAYYLWR